MINVKLPTSSITHFNSDNIERFTSKEAIDIIIPYLKKEWVIWAPFSENFHHYADYLRSKGFNVINTHINNGQDFLTYEPDFHFDIILDNPPFKGKTKFVERAISFKKPFALFLPAHFWGDNGIPNLFIDNNLDIEVLIPNRRANFWAPNEDNTFKRRGISFKTIYVCNKILPKQIIFVKMEKEK